ncbi:protein C3orf33 homolog isoform X22 [Oncorhynchus keta]|uniref:protein C3orf33 homolog isoform X22 n=1 Tax=Oncorhynchus keta TaxID=8018 RepID=UPI00227CBB2B|nr:protein C3orf33 homolog isoform X22 [Oncorhynchus keta]
MCVSPGRSSLLRCTVCVSHLAGLLSSGVLYVCLTWQVFSPQVYCMCVLPGRSSLLRCTVCVSHLAGLLSSGVPYVCLTWQVFSPQVYCMCVLPGRSSLLRCTVCVSHLTGLLSSGVPYVCLTWQVFSPQVYRMCVLPGRPSLLRWWSCVSPGRSSLLRWWSCVSPGRSSLLRCTVCVSHLAGLLSSGVLYVCLTWQVFSPQVYCMCVSPGRSSLLRCTVCVSHLAGLLSSGGGRVYPLAVRLAGVELTPEGRVWLEQHLSPAQTVWLKLVSREEETLQCLVSVSRGSLRSLCLNEEVLRLGLARTVPVSGLHPQSHLYLRLHQRLLKAEVKAERKGRGMWKEDSLWERTSQAVWDNSLVRLIRRIFKWM